MNKTKHGYMMGLLLKAGIQTDDDRHDFVYDFTEGRTTRSTALTDKEMSNIIWKLENDFGYSKNINPTLEIKRRNKRAVILSIATTVGFFPDGSSNFDYFNRFMKNSSILKKQLWRYNLQELDELVRQFKKLEANFENSAKVPGTKAWHIKHGIPMTSGN